MGHLPSEDFLHATAFVEVAVFVVALLVQLVMAMLSGTPMRVTPYVLLVCAFVFVFVVLFAFAVYAGMRRTWQRRGLFRVHGLRGRAVCAARLQTAVFSPCAAEGPA